MRPINASTVETIVEDSIFHFLVFRFGEEKKKKSIRSFVKFMQNFGQNLYRIVQS